MSKMDGLRQMREARYAEAAARAKAAPRRAAPVAPVRAAAADKGADQAPGQAPEEAPDEEVCGHRNMGGRTCTRERGHAAKSHRYS